MKLIISSLSISTDRFKPQVKFIFKSEAILSLTELKILFKEEELLVVKKGNRLSITPIKDEVAKIILEKIKYC